MRYVLGILGAFALSIAAHQVCVVAARVTAPVVMSDAPSPHVRRDPLDGLVPPMRTGMPRPLRPAPP